jgi:hypothetical protein
MRAAAPFTASNDGRLVVDTSFTSPDRKKSMCCVLRGGALFLSVAVFGLAGCGSGLHSVSGEIKLDGKVLDNGHIEFHPSEKQRTMAGAAIKNGHFTVPSTKGLEPGWYRVRITSPVGGGQVKDAEPGIPGAEVKDRIPSEYNDENSTLKFEVKAGQDNVFNYDVPTQPPQ